MDKMEQAQDEYADTFNGKAGEDSTGYGINPAVAEMDAMAKAFAEPDVVVGAPIKIEKIEAQVLPAATGEASPDPMVESQPEQTEQPATSEAQAPEAKPEFKTFGQAFKYHRAQAMNGGPSTFEWNGKKFTTQLKSEVAPGKAKPAKNKAAAEAAKFESEFINRDKPPANPVDRSKTLAFRDAVNSQPLNLDADPTAMKSIDEIAAGVARAAANKAAKPAPAAPPAKDAYYRGNGIIKQGEKS